MTQLLYDKPLPAAAAERAAVALATVLTAATQDDALEALHAIIVVEDPRGALNRTSWLLCAWDFISEGGQQ